MNSSPRHLALRLGALSLPLFTACAQPSAPPPDFAQEPPAATPALSAGARVQVSRGPQNQLYPATVLRDVGNGRFLIRYDGAGPEWDEVVGSDRIKADPAAAAAGAIAKDYRAGEKVLVTVQNRQVLGDVVQQIAAEQWRVHYDGYPPQYAENVGPDRLSRPFAGPSQHAPGAALTVDVQGRAMPAKVLALVAADKWLVRYDGYGPEYDQIIGPQNLKAGAAPAPAPAAPTAAISPPVPPPVDPTAKSDKDKAPEDKAGKDKDKDKDKAAKVEPPPAPAGPLQVGEEVLVSHRGSFHAAKITAAGAPGKLKIKYAGASTDEEEIGADRVMRLPAVPKGTVYVPQQKVFIEWHGMHFPGKVLKDAGKGQYKIRWEGTGPESDETVVAKRLRPRS